MGRTIACANQKGGVGKTTTVVNLATYLALSGDRVVVIDLDPQGNATSGLGVEKSEVERSVYDAFVGSIDLADLVQPTGIDGLSIIPSSIGLAGAEVELAPLAQRERRLARLIAPVAAAHDHVLIDTPPSLGLLTVNALTAADAVLVPIQCEYYALEGLTQLMATLNLVRDHLNPSLSISGVVMTMFDARTNLSGEVVAEVRRHLSDLVFETVIPRSVRLSEAPSHGLPIAFYRGDSKGAQAYAALADEFRAREAARAIPNAIDGVAVGPGTMSVLPPSGGAAVVPFEALSSSSGTDGRSAVFPAADLGHETPAVRPARTPQQEVLSGVRARFAVASSTSAGMDR